MHQAIANCNGKIWLFTNHNLGVTVIRDTEQQLTVKVDNQFSGFCYYVTVVYAKCDVVERLHLWEDIYSIAYLMDSP